jgi:hypothetical protein
MSLNALQDYFKIFMDIEPQASVSTGTNGVGVCFNGYDRATIIGMSAEPDNSSSSAATMTWSVRIDSDCYVASDCTYAAFSTDVTTSAMTFDTTDYRSFCVIDVDLKAHGETGGCICSRCVSDGTTVSAISSVIILHRGSGGRGEQPTTGATAATSGRVDAGQTIEMVKFP